MVDRDLRAERARRGVHLDGVERADRADLADVVRQVLVAIEPVRTTAGVPLKLASACVISIR